jgi:hexosaminidase
MRAVWKPWSVNDHLASLLPQPASVRRRPGSLDLGARPLVTAGPGAAMAAAAVRRALASWPWPDGPGPSRPDDHPGGQPGDLPGPEITVEIDPARPVEGYRLDIGPERIQIAAGAAAGAFYAAQTLRQLLPDAAWRAAPVPGAAWALPCAEISDAPTLAWRGAHLDVARHFFPKRELLTLIDSLAALKLNRLHLHLTDDQGWRIESRAYPALHEIGSHRPRTRISLSRERPAVYDETPHGGCYTLDDLAEVTAYAAQRMMTVVPEIDIPGHATALLAAVPELGARGGLGGSSPLQVAADWGILPHLISPLPETKRFLEALFSELLGAIPTGYVHIGGDECVLDSWRADPRVDAYRIELGLASAEEQHAHFLRETADLLAERFGVRAVVWDEGFASGSGTPSGRLRPDTVVMAWRGMDIARRAAEAGHEVIASPVFPTYFDYYQADDDREPVAIGGPIRAQDVAAFRPVPSDWPAAAAERLVGTQFQVWTEYIRDGRALEYMVFPRACAFAEVAWTGGPVTWSGAPGRAGGAGSPLRDRLAAHERRLDAAGVEYRPLDGPRPWQQGGTGPRRHRAGYRVADVVARLDGLAAAP